MEPAVPPDYDPFVAGPFRWRLGMRPLDLHDWIEIGDGYAEEMAVKSVVRARHPDTVFVALPDATQACQEILDHLVQHLLWRFPQWFELHDGAITAVRSGDTVALDGSLHPLDAAGRLVPEDLAVLAPAHDGSGEVFAAGSICFPNRWDLRSKLGQPLRAVHAPVSRLNDQLADPIDRLFARLTPDKSFWRLGWGVLDSPDLYQPVDGTAGPRPARPSPDDLVVRIERETVRRFARTGAVLFTIRTYISPLRALLPDTERAGRLRSAIDAMPDDVRAYKQIDAIDEALSELFDPPCPPRREAP